MPRWFNVAGPCNEADHYMLPAMRRLPRIARLIERKSYFILHAPRQVGKTTALLALGHELDAFIAFWRQHGEPLLTAAQYHEIAPHLVLMAFLHRVANGGGSIEREYAIGSGRMDLLVRYHGRAIALELKVWRDQEPDPLAQGLVQLDGYLAGLGLDSGWLVIFDRRSNTARLADRTASSTATSPGARRITVIRA